LYPRLLPLWLLPQYWKAASARGRVVQVDSINHRVDGAYGFSA
jgi:hypothetical protein